MAFFLQPIQLFYGIISVILLAGSLSLKPSLKGWRYILFVTACFIVGGTLIHFPVLTIASSCSLLIGLYRYRKYRERMRKIEVKLIDDRDDFYLQQFLNYYRKDIMKNFPRFDFNIEEEYLIAILFSEMESVGLIVAEIKDQETIRLCIDYIIPKYRHSELAKTFYLCELRCIDFMGFRRFYIEPQSHSHNRYLEKVGFKLVDGKYVNLIH